MEERDFDERWGSIARTVERIGYVADELRWEELVDMVSEAFDKASKEKSSEILFFDWFQFFFRLYHRVKRMKEPQPFNEIYNDKRYEKNEPIEMFRVANYDYKMYLWAKRKDCLDTMTNGWFLVRKDKLTPAELGSFEGKVKN